MGNNKIQNLKNSVNFAKIIKRLKCPILIKHFVESASHENLCAFYRIIANLLHNDNFAENSLIKKKIPKLRKLMSPHKKEWTDITKTASVNTRRKRKFLIEQTGSGNILSIISTVLPLLLSLIWKKCIYMYVSLSQYLMKQTIITLIIFWTPHVNKL